MTAVLNGPPAGFTVKTPPSTAAQVAAGRKVKGLGAGSPNCVATAVPTGPLRHGTGVAPWGARPPAIDCCPAVGAKMLLWVSKGTESCASERRPSLAANRKVLSFL